MFAYSSVYISVFSQAQYLEFYIAIFTYIDRLQTDLSGRVQWLLAKPSTNIASSNLNLSTFILGLGLAMETSIYFG